MKITVKEINLLPVDPATSGKLAKLRAKEINDMIEHIVNFLPIEKNMVFDVDLRAGGKAKILNLGIYACP